MHRCTEILPKKGYNANLKVTSSSSDPQQWKSSADKRTEKKSPGYTLPPPTNPMSSLAPPKLHINLKEVTHFDIVTLMLPLQVSWAPLNPDTTVKSLQLFFSASSESLIEQHAIHYTVFCHAAGLLHLDVPHSIWRPRPKRSERLGTSMGNISVCVRVSLICSVFD